MTEPRVGVYGLRTFRVSGDGYLRPLIKKSENVDVWKTGAHEAFCLYAVGDGLTARLMRESLSPGGVHQVPADNCDCGVYATRDFDHLFKQYPGYARDLVAVVELSGRAIEGTRGWRAQAGRVVAVWVRPGVLTDELLSKLDENLPGVTIYSDLIGMLTEWKMPVPELLPAEMSQTKRVVDAIAGFLAWGATITTLLFLTAIVTGLPASELLPTKAPFNVSVLVGVVAAVAGLLLWRKRNSMTGALLFQTGAMFAYPAVFGLVGGTYGIMMALSVLSYVYLKLSRGSFNPFAAMVELALAKNKPPIRDA